MTAQQRMGVAAYVSRKQYLLVQEAPVALELCEGVWVGVKISGSCSTTGEYSVLHVAAAQSTWVSGGPSPVLALPPLLRTAQKRDQSRLFQIYGTITCPSAVPRPSCRTREPAEPGMEFSERIRLPRAAAEKSRPGVITPRVPHPSELDNPFPRHPVGARDRSQPGVPLPGACACDSPPRTVDPSSALEVPARGCKGPQACLTLYRATCRAPDGGRAFRGRYQHQEASARASRVQRLRRVKLIGC